MGNPAEMFALVNLVLCMGIVFVCVCRLNKMTRVVLLRVRTIYTVYLNCALASALQPMWGEWPQWGAIAMATALLSGLLMSTRNWTGGPPADAHRPDFGGTQC